MIARDSSSQGRDGDWTDLIPSSFQKGHRLDGDAERHPGNGMGLGGQPQTKGLLSTVLLS